MRRAWTTCASVRSMSWGRPGRLPAMSRESMTRNRRSPSPANATLSPALSLPSSTCTCQLYFLGQLDAATDALTAARQHVERHGTADQRNWLRIAEAHQAILHGRWNAAAEMLEARIAEAEAGLVHYLDPTCHAFTRARETKDPQITAPGLALCATVPLTQGRR